jgi:putative ABC transport system substrate-binding protein
MLKIIGLQVAENKHWRFAFTIWIILIILYGCTAEDIKIYRVGIICGTDSLLDTITGFKTKMDELGYIEGQNILYDIQKVDNDPTGENRFVNRFIGEKVDLIFAFPNETAITAKVLTQSTNIPVIFAYSVIEGTNLVNNLREPGGNITGVRYPVQDITIKRFEYLIEMDPKIRRIWLAYDLSYPLINNALLALRPAAQSKGITLIEVPITTLDEIQADLAARDKMSDPGMDAILIMPDLITQSPQGWELIDNFSEKHKIPIAAVFYNQIFKGALFQYGNDYVQVGKTAATLANKILHGTPAGNIPVVSPEGYLRINLVRANTLDLTIPEGVLKQAVEIVH